MGPPPPLAPRTLRRLLHPPPPPHARHPQHYRRRPRQQQQQQHTTGATAAAGVSVWWSGRGPGRVFGRFLGVGHQGGRVADGAERGGKCEAGKAIFWGGLIGEVCFHRFKKMGPIRVDLSSV